MPRKEQGWITFQSSEEERRILEEISQQTQRTKTEILREMIRHLGQSFSPNSPDVNLIEFSEDLDGEEKSFDPETETILQNVKISARNVLKAKVKRILKTEVNAEVTLAIAPGVELVAIVTSASADKLGLKVGKQVLAVVKSSSIMIAASGA